MIARTPMAGPGASAVPALKTPHATAIPTALVSPRICFLPVLAYHPHQHLAHGALGQPRERLLHFVKREHMIHHRPLAHGIQPSRDLLPGCLRLLGGEVRYRDSADPIAFEEKRCRIEIRHFAAAPAHYANAP